MIIEKCASDNQGATIFNCSGIYRSEDSGELVFEPIEVIQTNGEVPLTRDSSTLVSNDYLVHLLLDAGLRLSRGREKLKRLNAHLVEERLKY